MDAASAVAKLSSIELYRRAESWTMLMAACGHTQNASDTPAKLHQDDATHSCLVTVGAGLPSHKTYYGKSFEEAIRMVNDDGRCDE